MKRIMILALATTLSAAAVAQDWQGFYIGALNCAKAGNWSDARIDFKLAGKDRPGDSELIKIPVTGNKEETWRHGEPYSPDFLAAYAGLKQAAALHNGDQRTTLLSQVEAEFESLLNRKEYSPELFFFLDQTYVLRGQTEKRITLANLRAQIGAAADWEIDQKGVDPADAEMIAELPAPGTETKQSSEVDASQVHFSVYSPNQHPASTVATFAHQAESEEDKRPSESGSKKAASADKHSAQPNPTVVPTKKASEAATQRVDKTTITQEKTRIHLFQPERWVSKVSGDPSEAGGDRLGRSESRKVSESKAHTTPAPIKQIKSAHPIVATKVANSHPAQPLPNAPRKDIESSGYVLLIPSLPDGSQPAPPPAPITKHSDPIEKDNKAPTKPSLTTQEQPQKPVVLTAPETSAPAKTQEPIQPGESIPAAPAKAESPAIQSQPSAAQVQPTDKITPQPELTATIQDSGHSQNDAPNKSKGDDKKNQKSVSTNDQAAVVTPVTVKAIDHPAKKKTSKKADAADVVPTLDNKYAIVIGNDQSKMDGGSIAFASSDAQLVRQALIADGGYKNSNIEMVINATAAQIADTVNALATRVPDKATVFIYFTGVGVDIDGKDYLAGVDSDVSNDSSTMVAKDDIYKAFMQRGARIFAFFQANRPLQDGHFFGSEVPLVGSISQMQATLPGQSIFSIAAGGKQVGLFTSAFVDTLQDIRSNQTPVMDFGWQLFYKLRSGGTGDNGGSSNQSPSLPVLTNMAADARF